MKTVDLSVNWLLYGVFLLLCGSLFSLVSMLESRVVTLSVLCYALLVASIVPLTLSILNKRFVHIDRAGISYSLGLGTRYILSEDIKHIQRKSFSLLTVLQVELHSGEVKSFYSWTLSEAGFARAEQLLASK
ncbi:hypothetical protein HG263_11805 [Pseudoalteromonas sp. JBTF-M23]|uniref:DUF304 domain-containing protein n=1 Tax=Pseudoalteromonas caenipelagi TaxID=2726988 RepID=A0A849VHK4_9GAMM|nr:hypothetical protein [Pseudoalteromonas caenipelagi]NOU51211.1 hypothetical protein [Pseudoalteromonas caenipelagi]